MSIPSSIWCQDSNLWTLDHQLSPITTRPGLTFYLYKNWFQKHIVLVYCVQYFKTFLAWPFKYSRIVIYQIQQTSASSKVKKASIFAAETQWPVPCIIIVIKWLHFFNIWLSSSWKFAQQHNYFPKRLKVPKIS